MGEVRYSVNGKYFKDFGIYVSDSDGLFDALKRKKINTYDWAEYHGSSPDLSNPKFEAREINLAGFVVGENWEGMKSNFDAIISEFQKAGTQRLLIEPFGLKALPYEVYMDDSISMKKTFKNGKMVGTFTLKMTEPNPIKKVLYFNGNTLNLSYDCPKETEIFYGNGLKETAKGNVTLSNKTLANRVVSGYAFEGRNYLSKNSLSGWQSVINFTEPYLPGGYAFYITLQNGASMGDVKMPLTDGTVLKNKEITVSFWANSNFPPSSFVLTNHLTPEKWNIGTAGNGDKNGTKISTEWQKFEITSKFPFGLLIPADNSLLFSNVKVELGNKATPYSPAPEDEKFIIIAGNVEEITNLTTNAEVLWEKL